MPTMISTQQTGGNIITDATASSSDVKSGKVFYNNNGRATGSLSLSGNADTSSVLKGKTFYSNSFSLKTGTLVLPEIGCKVMNITLENTSYSVNTDLEPDIDDAEISACVVDESFSYISYGIGKTTVGKWKSINIPGIMIGIQILDKTFGYYHQYRELYAGIYLRSSITSDTTFLLAWKRDTRNLLYYDYRKYDIGASLSNLSIKVFYI